MASIYSGKGSGQTFWSSAQSLHKVYGQRHVCRIEESVNPKEKSSSSAIEAISNIFNPFGAIEKKIFEIGKKVDVLYDCIVSSSSSNTSSNNGLGNITSCDDVSNESRRLLQSK